MTIKIAINGFGRIGRLAFRRIKELRDSELQVVAVNDLTNNEDLAYSLKYDTAYGIFPYDIEVRGDSILVDGKEVKTFEEKDAKKLPWSDLDIDIVLECTGFYTTNEKAQAHIDAGAKKVIISAPTKDEETKVVVFGVNQEILSPSDKIISAASCTTQNLQVAPGGRKSRAGAQTVIPVTTGADNALGKVIPEVKGIITGTTTRVPVITAGFVELFSVLDREVTVDQINEVMKAAANDSYGYTEDEIVSSDVVGTTHGSVFDATLTEVLDANGGQLVKTVAWYDNEYGFVSNMIRLVEHFSKLV